MDYEIKNYYEYQIFEVGEIAETLKKCFDKNNVNIENQDFTIYSKTDKYKSSEKYSYDKMYELCKLDKDTYCFYASFNDEILYSNIIVLEYEKGFYGLNVYAIKSSVAKEIIDIFEKNLKLKKVDISEVYNEDELKNDIQDLSNRVSVIENLIKKDSNITCFISLRFDEKSKELLKKLKKFLTLLDIEVITGLEYQPRRISEKVSEKLNLDIDFLIYIITNEGESFWTRDEIAIGYAKDYYAIPLVEKGAKFNSGIFGDLEYIDFSEGCIEKTFIKILEGIKYIKDVKS